MLAYCIEQLGYSQLVPGIVLTIITLPVLYRVSGLDDVDLEKLDLMKL